MAIALSLLKAPHVGVREFKEKISSFLNKGRTLVVTDHGEPTSVMVPYNDMLELLDILEESDDPEVRYLVAIGRKSIKNGAKGIAVKHRIPRKKWEEQFKIMRKNREDRMLIDDGLDLDMKGWEW